MPVRLASNRYGKHRVRVSKVRRPRQAQAKEERHEFVEFSVDIELEGDFDTAFTAGDNRQVIATDTCKNVVYALAKDHPLDTGESFGLAIAQHFIAQYDQAEKARITLAETVWQRLQESPHGFVARDRATPTAYVELNRGQLPRVSAGVEHLLIAKTTESGFANFHRDEFRTLADTDDRILATELSANWVYRNPELDFSVCRGQVIEAMLLRFLDHYSRSVQETLYLMGEAALEACAEATQISLTMPNKHHLLADLTPFGRENENEVFVVTDAPYGYIRATVSR